MNGSSPPGSSAADTGEMPVRRRSLLAAAGAVTVVGLSGCLSRAAAAVTNTGASPAAVFAGTQEASLGEFVVGEPHVSRLTPTVSSGQLGDVELEGWVTSSAVMAQDYNSSRSNKQKSRSSDGDADDDGLGDADEDDVADPNDPDQFEVGDTVLDFDARNEILAYLDGEPMVSERFTVCLPDAEVPGGNGSIREAVTPERLIAYLTGESDGEGRVYSWGTPMAGSDGGGDCDDSDEGIFPGAVCGTTPHFVAEVSGPTATGGGLEVDRTEDGSVFLLSGSAVSSEAERSCESGGQGRVGMMTMRECGQAGWPEATESGASTGVSVYQMMVQPPRCPKPFPALLYVQRCESNDQLVYTGGWVIDDAALYEDSMTVLSMAGPTEVVGVELSDLGGSFEDVAGGAADWDWPRVRRGGRLDSGAVKEFGREDGLEGVSNDIIDVITSRGGDWAMSGDDGEPGDEYGFVTHVAVDAPVRHLVSASRASQDVKFKAGAELSKAVN
ncbi:hypothetical protein [Salinigranum halophilum]|uniref:hypothetical protein n=1 Tax=Salinigranum halophilum TaxID=2565931 RepID=UPI001F2E39E7|nr:hypothetical protein [Salinigranum halophilum]